MTGSLAQLTYLSQELLHDLGSVVDSENNVGDASGDESLDLVDDHGLVAKLNQGLGESQGLYHGGIISYWLSRSRTEYGVRIARQSSRGNVREVEDGCRSHQQE